MNVINTTAYATIGCDVQLSENDRLALGIELDKVINWLETVIGDKSVTEDPYKAINNLVFFISKFAICPSQSNVFTASLEEFKKVEESVTTDESAPEDNKITVDIANSKNTINLTKIIHHATDASLADISELIFSAKEKNIPCISFKCTKKYKEDVVDELMTAYCTVVSNTAESLQLESYMINLNDHK